jgi:hypothetical protein
MLKPPKSGKEKSAVEVLFALVLSHTNRTVLFVLRKSLTSIQLVRVFTSTYKKIIMNTGNNVVASSFLKSLV